MGVRVDGVYCLLTLFLFNENNCSKFLFKRTYLSVLDTLIRMSPFNSLTSSVTSSINSLKYYVRRTGKVFELRYVEKQTYKIKIFIKRDSEEIKERTYPKRILNLTKKGTERGTSMFL